MRKKIFYSILLVSLVVVIACGVLFMGVVYNRYTNQVEDNLLNESRSISTAVEQLGNKYLKKIDTIYRITWINKDGSVLFDNEANVSKLENHLDREEVQQAIKNGTGMSKRYSTTLSQKTVNVAIRLSDGTILRISESQTSDIYYMLGISALVMVMAMVLSWVLALNLSKKIIKPINEINLESPEKNMVYDELNPFIEKIEYQNNQLKTQMTELKKEHNKQDKMRREFTANVSHELKTPLTSISGFAEIIRDGLVKQEDVSRFAGKIYSEAQRLIILVGDIIKLSRLDEEALPVTKEQIDLYSTCESTIASLESAANKKSVSISLEGEHVSIFAVAQIIDEMIYNLCDNAIKYNKDNGKIFISIIEKDDTIDLAVQDTGIGIPNKETERVFERFYRVNKSHSKEIGGTGLGLSIVKHGASVHNAGISIESELGKGTKITIHFTKAKK